MSQVPTLVYGTAWKEDRTAGLVTQALEAGFRAIDTANQRKHYFEAGVGEALGAAYDNGLVKREDLWLQTKFTYLPGQDQRLPYDPQASLTEQVRQSMASSLEHLGTTYVDSYVLHGPASARGWTHHDQETWQAMVAERDAGRATVLGVSNVWLQHLIEMPAGSNAAPSFVQNRCFARTGWDRDVRDWCREHGVVYQGFSLLTANSQVVFSDYVARVGKKYAATPAQVIFAFARQVGMLPLTGTTNADHMRLDLASLQIELAQDELETIEKIAI